MLILTVPASATAQLTQAEPAFAVDLYGQLDKTPGNIFFSPYSVGTALGMLYAGAGGSTAAEIAHTLHLENLTDKPGTNGLAACLQAVRRQPPGLTRLESANALWGAENLRVSAAYAASIRTLFDGGIFKVDFARPAAAARRIDDWVAAHTGDKITNLIRADQLNRQTRLVLTNAVYFKAGWADPFDAADTVPAPFHLARGRDVEAAMMSQTHTFDYAAGDGVQLVSLDYRGGNAAMIIILPDQIDGLSAIESAMTPEMLSRLLANASYQRVQLEMPKFVAESSFDLLPVLRALGMRQAFDPEHADLTGIAGVAPGRVFVSDVVHKAYVAVDEVGTVAAAATGVTITTLAAPLPTPPILFIADHPFIYLIRDNATGEILFLGRMADPAR